MPIEPSTASWVSSLRELLRERLGHEVPEERARGEIAAFAAARARAMGIPDAAAWVGHVSGPHGGEEWRRLVRVAMVGETFFCRHPEQLKAIVSHAASLWAATGRPLAVWSAGCATGEEAWSLAILLAEAGVPAEILATDVNDESLGKAAGAHGYSDRSAGHMPEALRARRLRREADGWRVLEPSSLRVTFAPHNLAHDAPPSSSAPDRRFDLILCRNVLLYFPEARVREVVARLLGALSASGGLWLGPADLLPADLLLAHRTTWDEERFFQRQGTARAAAQAPAAVPRVALHAPRPATPAGPSVEDLLRRGFVVSAEAALEQRTAARKDDGEARVALAAIAVSRHDVDRALAILESAKRLLPRPRGLDYVRGLALLRGGRAEAAADAFAEALEEEPDDWAASFQLALHFRRSGRRLQEEVALEHALLRLEEEPIPVPDHGPAAILLDSVHRDPAAALREGRLRRTEIATRAAGRSP